MSYLLHPSKRLVESFKKKPWQGNDPAKAQFLFIGLDANYAPDIENTLPEVFSYLDSGVEFWRTNGVHHPIRLSHYQGNGRKYHDKFSEIGFTPKHAELVSFIELLHLPTTGVSSLKASDLSKEHLENLKSIIDYGSARYIFVFRKVTDLMRQTKLFSWLPTKPQRTDGDLAILRERDGQVIYQMYHLSCYGWQLEVLNRQISRIRKIVELL